MQQWHNCNERLSIIFYKVHTNSDVVEESTDEKSCMERTDLDEWCDIIG